MLVIFVLVYESALVFQVSPSCVRGYDCKMETTHSVSDAVTQQNWIDGYFIDAAP